MVEELTFSFATMLQIAGGVAFAASSFFYLRFRFEANTNQLNTVTETLSSLDKKIDTKFETMGDTIVKIEAHGSVMEERISNLSERVNAMAGPRR